MRSSDCRSDVCSSDLNRWANACFRDFWQPTATSIRRSPANPMQPSPIELRRRVGSLEQHMRGAACLNMDIMAILNHPIPNDSVVYVDQIGRASCRERVCQYG